jgi:hypothetical protein
VTRSAILWSRAVAIGRELLWASTYGERCVDPSLGRMPGAVQFPPGDERQVRYLTPIGRRIPDALTYDPGTRILHVGDGSFGVRAHVGPGGFSAYVAEALEQRVAMDELREIVADFDTDNDPSSREEVEAARAVLRHDQRGSGSAAA